MFVCQLYSNALSNGSLIVFKRNKKIRFSDTNVPCFESAHQTVSWI